jgi:DNA-binding Lrp family transcriptional regulator
LAPDQELLRLADYDAVFEVFAAGLAGGGPNTVDALTAEAERVTRLEVAPATVREVVNALVDAGVCTRAGLVLTPKKGATSPGAVPSSPGAAEAGAAEAAVGETPAEKRIRDRESWMRRFVKACRPWFEEIGAPLPPQIRLTMSLTRGKRMVAACYSRAASQDGTNEILVRLDQAEAIEVADHILHELVHAADDCQHGHRGPFKKIARKLGLEGPLKSTKLGPEARARCERIIATLGPFPHAALDVSAGKRSGPARQKNRHVKCWCDVDVEGESCGYTCRTTRAWIERGGPPYCPLHLAVMTVEGADAGDGEGGEDGDAGEDE